MRTTHLYKPESIDTFKKQLLAWSQQFYEVVWMDSNGFNNTYSSFDTVLAVDAITCIQTDYHEAFIKLKEYQSTTQDWIFGYLTYDLKNAVENLKSRNFDGLQFPELYFFQPKKLFFFHEDMVEMCYLNMVSDEFEADLNDISQYEPIENKKENTLFNINIKSRIQKADYLDKVKNMLEHIHRGDIYEANFCQEFYAENTNIQPLEIYQKLNTISKPPFATFIKLGDKYVLSASPERYLKKTENKIISQPIKGTAKRSKNKIEDNRLKEQLALDEKERSENIMIVDLVRNDLSKTAIKGSVQVEELCKVYSFPQVHQMISTITSEINTSEHAAHIIESTFPMGSMTGAPKISAMKIIEDLEETKRGVYSGAVGYFTPNNDFDFNVVIRSILYNETKQYVSFSVGSAITAKSNPLKEYEECLIKAKAMREVLENEIYK
ncbi:aminodeoxychorismate synthase component I [Xanthomarina sp. F2636L]|uniref:aminodeoxychorismate synthase component I n=1 Tax=Xanthomarina sp. F2636L TaxID=2996018 RepID=UPI00225E58A8|nr:aminodeoxychorismate synthase component I [Xanthomarina sp. F2636L]MCX7549835.1 aminodeoxychorismate synthase component I [Xanthomarina sp. F2636L]